jgi:EpsI family protein
VISKLMTWAPAALLAVGAVFTVGIDTQKVLPLRAPLVTALPMEDAGLVGHDVEVSEAEQKVAGMDNYLMRYYSPAGSTNEQQYAYSVYVGYYETQRQGNTIHSPKNCLPGAGWESLASTTETVQTSLGPMKVNRYLLKKKDQAALVLYWYQGRGRVEGNEYAVKWQLLRDAALRGRSDEALVRIIVPITTSTEAAAEVALKAAEKVIPAVDHALPAGI